MSKTSKSVDVSRTRLRRIKKLLEYLEPDIEHDFESIARRAVAFYQSHIHNLSIIQRLEEHIKQEEKKNEFTFDKR